MTLSISQTIIIVIVCMIATMLTRFLPFILFRGEHAKHPYIQYLGQVLPYASIGLLVIYCLKHINPLTAPHGLPEAIAIILVAGLQYIKGNTLLSIGSGTVLYMFLVQTIFV